LQTLFGDALPIPAENLQILEGGESLTIGARKLEVVYTPGHASHHVSYFDHEAGVAFVGDTTGVRIEGHSFAMPATPPPDVDLELWDASFAAILERKPARLYLTHFGYSDNPAEHILLFRERLQRWAALTAEILRTAASDSAAMDSFMSKTYAEISQFLPADEVDHYAFSAGLNLSFLGYVRYLRKRATAAS
jgi:glyoxylase-like metal-dependent hydrolase (beta-lactamase superfamily II)